HRTNGYIPSWPLTHEQGGRTVQIDTMPVLPLLYWAANDTKDTAFLAAGEHTRKPRGSILFVPTTRLYILSSSTLPPGHPTRKFTFRGYADGSCWSRGQAWAIYGFYRYCTGDGKYRISQLAARLVRHFLGRLDDSLVPSWDFDDPANPNSSRDSSAPAAV